MPILVMRVSREPRLTSHDPGATAGQGAVCWRPGSPILTRPSTLVLCKHVRAYPSQHRHPIKAWLPIIWINLACFPGLGPSGRLPEAYPGYASLQRPQYLHLIVLDRGGVAGGPVHQISLVPRKLVFSYVRALPVTRGISRLNRLYLLQPSLAMIPRIAEPAVNHFPSLSFLSGNLEYNTESVMVVERASLNAGVSIRFWHYQ
jgi:hypothetical protein